MPFEITFDNFFAGYAEEAVKNGGQVKVSEIGFFSSEDGDQLIKRLEGIPQDIINKLSQQLDIHLQPGAVNTLLAIIRDDKTATVYLNDTLSMGLAHEKA